MRLPVSWLRDHVATDASADAIADALTARGFTVDAIDVQPTPERIVVGRIETLAPHPNADKLQVGSVDVGTERLQIVTGARNVAAGDKVPIALVGAVVFAGAAVDGEMPTKKINPAKLRGVESNGMMASANELALPGEFEDGILIMDADAPVGADFWTAVRFGDAVLDVDVPSNRADCLSVLGLAREAAAGLRAPFREPQWGVGAGAQPPPIVTDIADPSVCRRLIGQSFSGITNGRAPLWMMLRLQAAGVRSIDFLVDVSNYVQLETGQPLHFYDAGKLRGGKLIARASAPGERVVTLDGVERELPAGTPVIADGERLVGVAGIFGGLDTGVTQQTTEMYLESPNFVGPRIRRASFALGLRTEGATRHERGLPLELAELGRRRAAELLIAAGARASAVSDAGELPGDARTIAVRPERVNAVLGTQYEPEQMRASLTAIGMEVGSASPMPVVVPWWRPDLVEEIDIVEEVARGIGFDGIPERRSTAAPQAVDDTPFEQERAVARACAALGYVEVVTIALQGTRAIATWERSGIPFWTDRTTIDNPLSDDQRFLRPSLLPGVLVAAAKNWPRSQGALRLFEIGHEFRPPAIERAALRAVACFPAPDADGALDRHLLRLKGDGERLIRVLCGRAPRSRSSSHFYLHPRAGGEFLVGDVVVGRFGRLHPRLAAAYELPETTYTFSLLLDALPKVPAVTRFTALPRFPGTRRDLAVVVAEDVEAGALIDAVRGARIDTLEDVTAFDEYVGAQVPEGKKSVALALSFRRADATITDAEADAGAAAAFAVLRDRFDAVLRGPGTA